VSWPNTSYVSNFSFPPGFPCHHTPTISLKRLVTNLPYNNPDIPHFKEVVIMATNCEKCGHRDNEVKSSGGIEKKGHEMKLEIKTAEDMTRDVLKVSVCGHGQGCAQGQCLGVMARDVLKVSVWG
jgi:hypothetical protein